MIRSWWDFGEYSGSYGEAFDARTVTCPFCTTRGNFRRVSAFQNTKPNGTKTLNYDTYQCQCCTNHILVFWSASENMHPALYSYIMIPEALKNAEPRQEWPESIGKLWSELNRCMQNEIYQAAAMTSRSLLQLIFREMGSEEDKLVNAIDTLYEERKLSETMKEWAHELRLLGNEAAHAKPDTDIDPQDVKDVVSYIDFLLVYLYTLPNKIEQYRSRKE